MNAIEFVRDKDHSGNLNIALMEEYASHRVELAISALIEGKASSCCKYFMRERRSGESPGDKPLCTHVCLLCGGFCIPGTIFSLKTKSHG